MNARTQRLSFASLAVALASLAGGCAGGREGAEATRLYNQGIEASAAGARDAAYSYFVRASKLDPENHRALYEMALIDLYDKRDAYQKGLAELEMAESIQPRDRDVLYQLERAAISHGNHEQGLRYAERALAEDPNYAPAWYYRGVGYHALGQLDQADHAFRETIAIDPTYTPAYRELGAMYEEVDAADAARKVYEEGLRHDGDDPDLLNALGVLALSRGEKEEAVDLLKKAKGYSDGRSDVLFNLAFAYVEAGDTREAFRNLGEYLNGADPGDVENIRVATMLRNTMVEELRRQRREAEEKGEPPPPDLPETPKPGETPDAP
ncbi:MAG: tetratricopeptide repeat protein, partial [Myxococcales bacterium]|nr:tetratricopeptide repeat protein [Myxococcales bacterium]MCB9733037.1 tetratricopeptide repeat protein [Deltaproteobacteria bacterium]